MKRLGIVLAVLAVVGLTACGSPQHTKTLTISFTRTTALKTGAPITVNVGDILTASPGTWTGNPTYAYQWQDCNADASTCTNIAGATSQTYTVASGDAGYYLRVAVTATNVHGSKTAHSALTGQVPGTTTSTTTSWTTGQTMNCFVSPGACGYPDPAYGNVGVTNCSSLATQSFTPSSLPSADYFYSGSGNEIEITANNVTISNTNIGNYWFYLAGVSGFTLNNVCMSPNSGDPANSIAVWPGSGSSGVTVKNSTIVPAGCSATTAWDTICTGNGVYQTLVGTGNNGTVTNDILVGGVEPINGFGSNTLIQDNYVVANGYQAGGHGEDIYGAAGASNVTIQHNTLLNPFDQTASVFFDSSSACANVSDVITGNLMAGGGFLVYPCSNSSSAGTSSWTITNNDFARCAGTPTASVAVSGNTHCGSTDISSGAPSYGSSIGAGQDTHGYWPDGGGFGISSYIYCSNTTWSGNTWDDDGSTVGCS